VLLCQLFKELGCKIQTIGEFDKVYSSLAEQGHTDTVARLAMLLATLSVEHPNDERIKKWKVKHRRGEYTEETRTNLQST